MEYDDTEKDLNVRYSFMLDKVAKKTFAKLDYLLKSGMHIQRDFPKPTSLYTFLDKHYTSLQAYYDDFFEMLLKKEGEEWNTYFYIDFHEGSRGKIPTESQYRWYLKSEHILVGLIFLRSISSMAILNWLKYPISSTYCIRNMMSCSTKCNV